MPSTKTEQIQVTIVMVMSWERNFGGLFFITASSYSLPLLL